MVPEKLATAPLKKLRRVGLARKEEKVSASALARHLAEVEPQRSTFVVGLPGWRDRPCYYVSVRDGARWGFLAGPFPSHARALAMVGATKAAAVRIAPGQAAWAEFGTALAPDGRMPGRINDLLGIEIRDGEDAR